MAENIFTPDFYKALYDAIVEASKGTMDLWAEEIADGESVGVDCYVDNYYITAEVIVATEWHDESFDHAFGTWHDPNPYLEVVGCEEIFNIHVYEGDTKDAKEIEGFSEEAFWSQFEVEKYGKYSKGDKVIFGRTGGTIVAYNTELGKYKIVNDKGIYHIESQYIKKVA